MTAGARTLANPWVVKNLVDLRHVAAGAGGVATAASMLGKRRRMSSARGVGYETGAISGTTGKRYSVTYKRKRLSKKGRKKIKAFKKFSKKVSKVQYANLGTRQIYFFQSVTKTFNDAAAEGFSWGIMTNANEDFITAGTKIVNTFDNDISRIFYHSGVDSAAGTGKADSKVFLKAINVEVNITAVNANPLTFTPFRLEVFHIRARSNIAHDETVQGLVAQYDQPGLTAHLYNMSQNITNAGIIGSNPVTYSTDEATVPAKMFYDTQFTPTIFPNFGSKYKLIKKEIFTFGSFGDTFTFKSGHKSFLNLTETYWKNVLYSAKYSKLFIFKLAAIQPTGAKDVSARFDFKRNYTWAVEGTVDGVEGVVNATAKIG